MNDKLTNPQTTRTGSQRLVQLDFLRGIAILLVIGRHMIIEPRETGSMGRLSQLWFEFGWSGVDLFFVLSGFLVGGLLFAELRTRSHLNVQRFLIRRGFKIWPAYFVYLATLALIMRVIYAYPSSSVIKSLLPNLVHLQNYLGTPSEHTWSLAVEEHFYFVLPFFLLLVFHRFKGKLGPTYAVPLATLALIFLCTTGRYLTYLYNPAHYEGYLYPTHLRIDGLFFGVLLGYLYHFKPEILEPIARQRLLLIILGLILISPMMFIPISTTAFVPSLGLAMLYLGYGCLLIVAVYSQVGVGWLGKFFGSAPARLVAFIGFYSYPIYLWHVDAGTIPLRALLGRGFLSQFTPELRWVLAMLCYIAVATAVGVLLGVLVEKPALRLRDRLFPTRAHALTEEQGDLKPSQPTPSGLTQKAQPIGFIETIPGLPDDTK